MFDVLHRISEVISILAELFIACLPIYIVLILLDKLGEKLSARLMAFDFQAYMEKKLEAAKAREQLSWKKRAEVIDERDKRDEDASGNT